MLYSRARASIYFAIFDNYHARIFIRQHTPAQVLVCARELKVHTPANALDHNTQIKLFTTQHMACYIKHFQEILQKLGLEGV